MLNLLISLIGDTFHRVKKAATEAFYEFNRAAVFDVGMSARGARVPK